ncbi:MAG: polyribonucleotide nucleotidyltransferase [Anaerolineaceae bacterium 4572_32.2]|nr:MAG: polyribonucleotide nucleotidyltransferase [Anaerolineaceae bacterium 4572_32.2]RLC79992.1 MAG: polyribonucleotide nucleotidyltransferase [Chloroflexota bacterium]HEY74221.1 polyribonucleotide nucleotidyltransferase [Thermoflexia bacterium]
MNSSKFTTTLGGEVVTIETGKLAQQAGGAVTVRCGDTMLLVTATMARTVREGIGFFPLTVDFEERLYAAGRIPGSFFRREGRPPESAILTMRLTDRPIRPLFPKGMRNDVQVVITPLSHDEEHQLDILSIIGASAALTISDIPFAEPVGAARVGYVDGEFVIIPVISQMENSTLDLRLAGTADALLMVEAGADEVSEQLMIEALRRGHEAIQDTIRVQSEMRAAVGKPKRDYVSYAVPDELRQIVRQQVGDRMPGAIYGAANKQDLNERLRALRGELTKNLKEQWTEKDIREAFDELEREVIRTRTIEEGIRADGRDTRTIRQLSSEVGISPRAHGSGLFTRGETQVLSVATLGTPREEQMIDDLSPQEAKRYIHHYNFPPYSTGEASFMRGPKRREIGHGALAERALMPVLPDNGEFPYTIRVVSEALSSNGSTSMASVCGSTLSLMDAGVPIKTPVAGIAMGLMMEGERYRILTDIQGLEDHIGDMDFKVAGTREGITALQMDIKVAGLSYEILAEALEQANQARMQILDVIETAIPEPRAELSPFAPRMTILHVDPDKLGAVIGSGGKTVRAIQDEFDVRVDIEDDGSIYIASTSGPAADKAQAMIESLTEDAELGHIYTGRVVRTTDFGAFVEILPGKDGLVHISQLADYRVNKVEDVARVGDEIMVMVTNVGADGKIRLSRQAVLEGWTLEQAQASDRPGGGRRDRGNRNNRRRQR